MTLDEEGYIGLIPAFNNDENWALLYAWEQTCCEHEGMDFAAERIANWAGYRLFLEALENVGWTFFPVLHGELPNANGGLMKSDAAAEALAELNYFQQQTIIAKNAVLVDSTTGYIIFEHIAAYEGVFIFGGSEGIEVGVGEFEFFVRQRDTNDDLFRATEVIQTFLDHVDQDKLYSGRVKLTDPSTGMEFICKSVIWGQEIPWPDGRMTNDNGQVRRQRVKKFHVEIRDQVSSQFGYILEPLRKVFQASVSTGNPVRWC
jgi:hypothetical protein